MSMIVLQLQEITIDHSLPSNTLSEVFGVVFFFNFYNPHVICGHTRLIFQMEPHYLSTIASPKSAKFIHLHSTIIY